MVTCIKTFFQCLKAFIVGIISYLTNCTGRSNNKIQRQKVDNENAEMASHENKQESSTKSDCQNYNEREKVKL